MKGSEEKALNGSAEDEEGKPVAVSVSVLSLSSPWSSRWELVLNPLMELTGLLDPA